MDLELIIRITLVLHLLGFASLMTGTLGQIKSFKNGAVVLPSILHGAWLSLATGLALAGMLPANGEEVNHLVISLKTASLTAIFFIRLHVQEKADTNEVGCAANHGSDNYKSEPRSSSIAK
jgi:hypothetical protein